MGIEVLSYNYSGDGTVTHDVSGTYAGVFGLLVSGDRGTGSIMVKGGTSTTRELIQIINPIDGTIAGVGGNFIGQTGLYVFEAICEVLEFELFSSAAPDLDIVLFQEPRP